jgi:CRP-like cAMP-binding protein
MENLKFCIRQMIALSEQEMDGLLRDCELRTYASKEVLSAAGVVPNEIFFVVNGLLRVVILDPAGNEHSIHFAMENQFIADYASFMLQQPALYKLQALEETQVVVMPRSAIAWGYENMRQGDKMGRLIAEYYFIYQDNRIRNGYARTPKERYDAISEIFPNIHNRVPQHMIASYLGITPVHLSRLKKADYRKT